MAARCTDLPLLPGYSFDPKIGRKKFNKENVFDYIGPGNRALIEKVTPNLFGPLGDRYPSLYPRGEVPEIPAWIAYDKQILRFDAFFRETLQEFRGGHYLIRKVRIYFFLEDGTVQVAEPKTDNSGILQGTVISRQRIRLPAPMDANFYDITDFNVGREVEFYGRVFKIVDCDKFTRVFLNRVGISVPDPIPMPDDPYMKMRSKEGEASLPKKPNRKVDKLGQFLANDQKVLRFYGYWDDQETQFGYFHNLEIHFYLADDTIEIKELPDSAGSHTGFMFLSREKLPKVSHGLPAPGAQDTSILLNVLGEKASEMRYLNDALNCGKEDVAYYMDNDLTIGGVINVYGRKVVLTDCDEYTKQYYMAKYGVNDFTPPEKPEDRDAATEDMLSKKRELPPWNGYGTYEDSAQNCISLEPKGPKRDFTKFLKLDRIGMDSHILRFAARMISKIPENCTRKFIINYYLNDDTLSVFEIAERNSGFATNQFLGRGPVMLPGQAIFVSDPPKNYTAQHMYIGATLLINSFKFVLVDADEYALRYMEINSNEFPKSDINIVMDKVRQALKPIYKDFVAENLPVETPVITYEKLRDKICKILGKDFTEHEMVTISRAFSANCFKPRYSREDIRAITLTELKRQLWDDIERVTEYFKARDPCRTGILPRKECYTLLRACRLPLDKVLIERILDEMKKDENCNIYYNDLLDFLNREKCGMIDVIPINIKNELWFDSERVPRAGSLIDWCAFNKFLDLEKTFQEGIGPIEHH
ncbi:EF-hand domain-containing family member C2-like [Agrilus planipennis]|uniref:EF-hand domain-containing family member C2 n=1 Tax=Agrilus planipennis TaxID=224129 RepID=A0A1W4WPK9_AGRPL|nr:EF-hand domain-containing family member C2-like [Agrilus planipennis]